MVLALRAPILCILIVLYIKFFHMRSKNLKTSSDKSFNRLCFTVMSHLVLGLITEYTVNYRASVPENLNLFLHNLFYITVLMNFHMIYSHMLQQIEMNKQQHYSKERFALNICNMIFTIIIVCLPLCYIDTHHGAYSTGPKLIALFISAIPTILLTAWHFVKDKKSMSAKTRDTIILVYATLCLFYVVQLLLPFMLISELGYTIEVLLIYLSLEESTMYLEERTNLFNKDAFFRMLDEKKLSNSQENVALFALSDMDLSQSDIDSTMLVADENLRKHYGTELFVVSDNCFGFFMDSNINVLGSDLDIQHKYISKRISLENPTADVYEDIDEFIMTNTINDLLFDKMTKVYNRNKYELDVQTYMLAQDDFWYIIVDVNNLKRVNDTLGHKAGDSLIQNTARVLRKTFHDNALVYRIGGDEFVIISFTNDIDTLLCDLESRRKRVNDTSEIPTSFAIGYHKHTRGKWDETVSKADEQMYINKQHMKESMQAIAR